MNERRIVTDFALAYVLATGVLDLFRRTGVVVDHGVAAALSLCCLILAVLIAGAMQGRRDTVTELSRSDSWYVVVLFIILASIRAWIEAIWLLTGPRFLTEQWLTSWLEPSRWIELIVNFSLAFLVIRIGFPLARRVFQREVLDDTFG